MGDGVLIGPENFSGVIKAPGQCTAQEVWREGRGIGHRSKMALGFSDSTIGAGQNRSPGSVLGKMRDWGDGDEVTCTQELKRK